MRDLRHTYARMRVYCAPSFDGSVQRGPVERAVRLPVDGRVIGLQARGRRLLEARLLEVGAEPDEKRQHGDRADERRSDHSTEPVPARRSHEVRACVPPRVSLGATSGRVVSRPQTLAEDEREASASRRSGPGPHSCSSRGSSVDRCSCSSGVAAAVSRVPSLGRCGIGRSGGGRSGVRVISTAAQGTPMGR
jgi:hypothetical protein